MRKYVLMMVLVFVGALTWWVGSKLSSDAIGMAVGMAFGAMAGIPSALLVLYANRRGRMDDRDGRQLAQPCQPPIVVIQTPQLQRQPLPPSTVMCDPRDTSDENGFGYPLGTWGRVEPQKRIEVRR